MPVNKQAVKAIKLATQLLQNYPVYLTTFSTCSCCKSNPAKGGMVCSECLEDELASIVGYQLAKELHDEIKQNQVKDNDNAQIS
ncbi:hypothetical protein [Methylobacter tundripaludum]|uniref:hypothetical protein n=1 Tax=Methylobacter tundripaludum TaxID=173365 RepID=UPI0004DF6EFF|nr:hypothetical protein [Methylobacter tundripaludum]